MHIQKISNKIEHSRNGRRRKQIHKLTAYKNRRGNEAHAINANACNGAGARKYCQSCTLGEENTGIQDTIFKQDNKPQPVATLNLTLTSLYSDNPCCKGAGSPGSLGGSSQRCGTAESNVHTGREVRVISLPNNKMFATKNPTNVKIFCCQIQQFIFSKVQNQQGPLSGCQLCLLCFNRT